jgi:hypothetical protein
MDVGGQFKWKPTTKLDNPPIYKNIKIDKQHQTYENYRNFQRNLILLKYGSMAVKSFDYMESNLPTENFKKFPAVPVVVSFGNNEQEIFTGLIDSGSNNSFVDVYVAEKINGVIIDSMTKSGINSNIERKPVIQIKLSVDSMEGNWVELKVGVMDTHHPNHQIILGRDFMEIFKKVTFDFENKKTILDY